MTRFLGVISTPRFPNLRIKNLCLKLQTFLSEVGGDSGGAPKLALGHPRKMVKDREKYLSKDLLSDFLAVLALIFRTFAPVGFKRFFHGFDWLRILSENGAQMQRRNFLSSVFAALVAAKAVNAEERKLSPEVSEETKTKFDENTLLDKIKDDPAFSDYSNLLFPRGRTNGLRLRDESRLLPYHSYVMPKESAEVLNYMKDEVLKGKKIFYPLKTASNGRPVAGLFFFRGRPDAPFAIIFSGGGFQYVGAIHEGFPVAKFLAGKG